MASHAECLDEELDHGLLFECLAPRHIFWLRHFVRDIEFCGGKERGEEMNKRTEGTEKKIMFGNLGINSLRSHC